MQKSFSEVEFVKDRPGHDFRYSINCQKMENELKWKSRFNFDESLVDTIKWYENY
jgi:dTDP-glucose 4,6-dehydratase